MFTRLREAFTATSPQGLLAESQSLAGAPKRRSRRRTITFLNRISPLFPKGRIAKFHKLFPQVRLSGNVLSSWVDTPSPEIWFWSRLDSRSPLQGYKPTKKWEKWVSFNEKTFDPKHAQYYTVHMGWFDNVAILQSSHEVICPKIKE